MHARQTDSAWMGGKGRGGEGEKTTLIYAERRWIPAPPPSLRNNKRTAQRGPKLESIKINESGGATPLTAGAE